ncbi:MAG TPA: hypothetical protein VFA26_02160, partial [Gemmataceae bacterium]|nr:hypothetical protein [Gemmataceae bacterium]
MAPTDSRRLWRYVRGLAPAVLLWALVLVALRRPLQSWLQGEQRYDEEAVREWVEEARAPRQTLPEMVEDYLDRTRAWSAAADRAAAEYRVALKREEIREHLKALGDPPTKMYAGQLPLFPVIYRLEVRFDADPHLPEEMRQPIVWDSQLPRREGQYRELAGYPVHPQAQLFVQYQLHAYSRQQRNEQAAAARLRWVIALAVAGTALALSWVYLVQHRERDRDRQEADAQKQIDRAERLRLEEELRRQEAERRREEAERRLLEQQLATQAAERQALELK